MFTKVFIQTKILCFRLNFYVFKKCVNKPLAKYLLFKRTHNVYFVSTKSDVQTQQKYRTKYGRNPPSRPLINRWHKKFIEKGLVLDTVRSG